MSRYVWILVPNAIKSKRDRTLQLSLPLLARRIVTWQVARDSLISSFSRVTYGTEQPFQSLPDLPWKAIFFGIHLRKAFPRIDFRLWKLALSTWFQRYRIELGLFKWTAFSLNWREQFLEGAPLLRYLKDEVSSSWFLQRVDLLTSLGNGNRQDPSIQPAKTRGFCQMSKYCFQNREKTPRWEWRVNSHINSSPPFWILISFLAHDWRRSLSQAAHPEKHMDIFSC